MMCDFEWLAPFDWLESKKDSITVSTFSAGSDQHANEMQRGRQMSTADLRVTCGSWGSESGDDA